MQLIQLFKEPLNAQGSEVLAEEYIINLNLLSKK